MSGTDASTRARPTAERDHAWPYLLAALLAGCSVVNETSEVQCSDNGDCIERFTDVAYSCVDNFCVRPTCTTAAQCQGRGAEYTQSTCGGDGLCSSSSAATAPMSGCSSVADCPMTSPGMQCVGGRCEDKKWGCIGQLDSRPAPVMGSATLQTTLINGPLRMPPSAATITMCNLPTLDPNCSAPVPGVVATYDPQSGAVNVSGVPQSLRFRMKIDLPMALNLMSLDVYSAVTPRDVTTLPPLATANAMQLGLILSTLNPPVAQTPETTYLWTTVFDCEGNPAEGVTLKLLEADRLPTTEVLYITVNSAPVREGATSANGVVLVANARTGRPLTLQAFVGNLRVGETLVQGYEGRLGFMDIQPRLY